MIVPLRDVVFWVIVFRNHGMMAEEGAVGGPLYTSTYALTDPMKLHEPLATLVRRLND